MYNNKILSGNIYVSLHPEILFAMSLTSSHMPHMKSLIAFTIVKTCSYFLFPIPNLRFSIFKTTSTFRTSWFMILLQADVSDLKTILRNTTARNSTGRPVAVVWRSCGTHGSTGPRPASGPSRYLIACSFCTSTGPPSDLGHKPETTATVIKRKVRLSHHYVYSVLYKINFQSSFTGK